MNSNCTYMNSPTFLAGEGSGALVFTAINPKFPMFDNVSELVTSTSLQCGVACTTAGFPSSTLQVPGFVGVTAVAFNETTLIDNTSYFTATGWQPMCTVTTSIDAPLGTACTAYLKFNDSYWVNGTTYAVPRNMTIDENSTVFNLWYPTPLVFWVPVIAPSGSTACPYYYIDSNYSSATFLVLTGLTDPTTGDAVSPGFGLSKQTCEVVTTGSSQQLRVTVSIVSSLTIDSMYFLERGRANVVSLCSPFFNVKCPSLLAANSSQSTSTQIVQPSLVVLAKMNLSCSSWRPLVNYSSPLYASNASRWYLTQPRAMDNTSTTLIYGSIYCVAGGGGGWLLDVTYINETTFLCTWPSDRNCCGSSIDVMVEGVVWFTDSSGLPSDATTQTGVPGGVPSSNSGGSTAAPPGSPTSPQNSSTGATTNIPSPSPADTDSSNESDTTDGVILGLSALGIVMSALLVAGLYFMWRPKQQASTQPQLPHVVNAKTWEDVGVLYGADQGSHEQPMLLTETDVELAHQGEEQEGSPTALVEEGQVIVEHVNIQL